MDYSCPNCSVNLQYKLLRVARKESAVLNGRYGCLLCYACGAKIAIQPTKIERYLRVIFGAIMILTFGAFMLDSYTMKFISGSLAFVILAWLVYYISKKEYMMKKRYRFCK